MYKYAHFYTFSFNMIIDAKSLNRATYFLFNNCRFKLNVPYKSYPYNHDFSYKPLLYHNSKGQSIKLPIAKGVCSYPLYDGDVNHIGMYVQANEVYSFDKAQVLKLSEDIPDKQLGFTPVDTIRFDTTIQFNNDSPKFLSDLISHLRLLSGQFWIGKPRLNNEGVTIEGIVKTNGIIDNFSVHSNLLNIIRYNKGIPIDLDIWESAVSNTINNIDINFARTLYLDALYEFANNNNRVVVLNIANSLDITINELFKSLHDKEDSNQEFDRDSFVKKHRKNNKISSTYIPGLVSEFLYEILNLNYKIVNPEFFEVIKVFWLEKRNTVAHGGQIKLEENEAVNLFDAVEDLTNWLNNITLSND